MKPILDWLTYQYKTEKRQVKVAERFQQALGQNDEILEDLRRFCFVYGTSYAPGDPVRQNMNEGRREVYLHIANMLELNLEELKPKPVKEKPDDRDAERNTRDE